MAKKSMVAREVKRAGIVSRYASKRAALREIVAASGSTPEQIEDALQKLQRLPRDASPSRQHNRCRMSGRPHGYYRKFGLGRNMLREAAMRGDVPGLVKASW